MKKYQVFIDQINQQYVEVVADDEEQAKQKAKVKWRTEVAFPHVTAVEGGEEAWPQYKLDSDDLAVLAVLRFHLDEYMYGGYKFLSDTKLNRKQLERIIKKLKGLGLVEYAKGLMTEDGEVAGSGFAITYSKRDEVYEILKAAGADDPWEGY